MSSEERISTTSTIKSSKNGTYSFSMEGEKMGTIRVRRYQDERCMGKHSYKASLCKLCPNVDECQMDKIKNDLYRAKQEKMKQEQQGVPEDVGAIPEIRNLDKSCCKCRFVKHPPVGCGLSRGEYDRCANDRLQGSAYCEEERSMPYDGCYHLCGIEGKLWEPRSLTVWEKIKAHLAHHVLGPEEHRVKRQEGKGFLKMLQEAIKGPEKKEEGKEVIEK